MVDMIDSLLDRQVDLKQGDEVDGPGDATSRSWFSEQAAISSISVNKKGTEICIVADGKLLFLNEAGKLTDEFSLKKAFRASYTSNHLVLLTTYSPKLASGQSSNNETKNLGNSSSSGEVGEVWTLSRPDNTLTNVTSPLMKKPSSSSSHGDVIYLADYLAGLLTSRDGGQTWQRLKLRPDPEKGVCQGADELWNHWCVASAGQRFWCVGNRFKDRSVMTSYIRVTSSSSTPEEDTYELERFVNAESTGVANFKPIHVIADSKGHLIVADLHNHAVHVFSSRGEYVKLLLSNESHGIFKPSCLTLSPDEKTLYVGYWKIRRGVIDRFPYDPASFMA